MAIDILYVEDNPVEIEQVLPVLRNSKLGFTVEVVNGSGKAQEYLASDNTRLPDILLSDVTLPDGSGLALLSDVRKQELPMAVVLLTEQGNEEAAVAALKAGADDYLVSKPELVEQLPATLYRAFTHFNEAKTLTATHIHVLFIEENPVEFDLMQRHINLYAPNIRLERIEDEDAALRLLSSHGDHPDYDLLLFDLHPNEHHPMAFIQAWRQTMRNDLPLVVITGQGSEEIAVEALRQGVSDYLVKHAGYLFRLPSVLENVHHLKALEKEKAALRLSEERFRRLADNAQDIIFRVRVRPDLAIEYASPVVEKILGVEAEALYEDFGVLLRLFNFKSTDVDNYVRLSLADNDYCPIFRLVNTRGETVWLDVRTKTVVDKVQGIVTLEGIARDVTEHKAQDEKIRNSVRKLNGLHLIDTAIGSSFDLQLTYRIFIDQAVSLLDVDAADILLFEPDLSTPRVFITSGWDEEDSLSSTMIQNFDLVDRDVLEKKIAHAALEQVRERSQRLYRRMASQGYSEFWAAPLISKGQVKGVFEVYQKEDKPRDEDWKAFVGMLAQQASIALENSRNYEKLQRSNQDLIRAYDETLNGWINLLDLRDKDTEGHTVRVLDIMVKVAETFGFRPDEIVMLRRGVILHDIGKIAVPDQILNKPGPLTEEEWEIMRRHPRLAYETLMPIDYLRPSLEIPYYHHEKWDGSGYPQGLKGKAIPLSARIFSVIDTFDALISYRSYRDPMTPADALEYIRKQAGIQFDPEVVERCLPLLKNYIETE